MMMRSNEIYRIDNEVDEGLILFMTTPTKLYLPSLSMVPLFPVGDLK